MNKAITSAIEAVRNNPTDTALVDALRALAVPKFKTIHGKVKSAVKTINRHLGEGKGHPNRAKIAEAIGLRSMIGDCNDISHLINMPEMTEATETLIGIIDEIETMRTNRAYKHLDFLPDFLTSEEKRSEEARDAKHYLANIIGAVNRSIESINKHIAMGDFGANTFKFAKAIGYETEIPALGNTFKGLATATETFAFEIALCDLLDAAIKALKASNANAFKIPLSRVPEYNPFPAPVSEEEEEVEDEE